jgi:hypothetical protein
VAAKSCPFLHYLERSRDKVIQDDPEFKDYLNMQDSITNKFMALLSLNTFNYPITGSEAMTSTQEWLEEVRLPNPYQVYGE